MASGYAIRIVRNYGRMLNGKFWYQSSSITKDGKTMKFPTVEAAIEYAKADKEENRKQHPTDEQYFIKSWRVYQGKTIFATIE